MEGDILLEAIIRGDLDTTVLLLDTGVTMVDTHNTRRETPLYWACARGDLDLCRVLVLRGATIDFRSVAGLTPLHAAADRGHHQCAELLLQNGAYADTRTDEGRTPLHLAAYRGNTAVMHILLRHRARHDVTDADGKTPVDVSACQGHWDDVRLLLNHRAHFTMNHGNHQEHSDPSTTAPSGREREKLTRQRSRSADRSVGHKTPYLENIGRRRSDDQIQLHSHRGLQAESRVISHGSTQQVHPLVGECMLRSDQTKSSLSGICGKNDWKQDIMIPEVVLDSISVNLQAESSVLLHGGSKQIKYLIGECMAGLDVNKQGSAMQVIGCLLKGMHQLGKYSERLEKEVREWKENVVSVEKENDALRQTMTEMLLSPPSSPASQQ